MTFFAYPIKRMNSNPAPLSVTEKYIQDVDCMRSYAALKERMFFNQTISTSVPLLQTAKKTTTKPTKATMPIKDYTSDDSVIIAIQNDAKFINIIMNCRKQKSTLAYIFVESEYNYITCIIKTPDSFPFMLIILPINKKYVYAKKVDNCYEFPLVEIISKDIKFNKSSSYSIVFKYNGKSVQFLYDIYNASSEPNRITIDNITVGSMTIIDSLFNTMMMSVHQYGTASMYSTPPSLLTFDTMSILILKEANSASAVNFNAKQTSSSNNYFKITEDEHLVYVSETNKKQNEVYICSREDSIIWTLNDVNIDFTMLSFESLFKINYNRSVMQNDRIYYVFASFLGHYMFVKVITSLDVTVNSTIDTFIKTFCSDYQILESYMCTKSDRDM